MNFPDISILDKLANILGVSVLELLSGERKQEDKVARKEAEEVLKKTIHQGTLKEKANKRNKKFYILVK